MKRQPRKHLEMKKKETKIYYPTKSTKSQEEKICDIWARTLTPVLSHPNRGKSAVRQVQAGTWEVLCPWIPGKSYHVPLIVVAATLLIPSSSSWRSLLLYSRLEVANTSDELYPALIHRVNTLSLACQARSITAVSPKTDVQYSEDHRLLTLPRNPAPQAISSCLFIQCQPL